MLGAIERRHELNLVGVVFRVAPDSNLSLLETALEFAAHLELLVDVEMNGVEAAAAVAGMLVNHIPADRVEPHNRPAHAWFSSQGWTLEHHKPSRLFSKAVR